MSERDKHAWAAIKADPVRYAAYLERKRRERKARPDYQANRKRRWREANPEDAKRIRQANHAVEAALKSGALVKPDACSRCPETKGIQGHHSSYAEADWLNVIWLCVKCHAAEHFRR